MRPHHAPIMSRQDFLDEHINQLSGAIDAELVPIRLTPGAFPIRVGLPAEFGTHPWYPR